MLDRSFEKLPGAFRIEVGSTAEATELILRHPEIFRDYEITKGKWTMSSLLQQGRRLREMMKNDWTGQSDKKKQQAVF